MNRPRRHPGRWLPALTLLAASIQGCTGDASPDAVLLSAVGGTHETMLGWRQADEQPVRLATSGTVDVDVDLFAGSVTIEVDPSLTETLVRLRRVGSHGWGRTDEAMESLGEIRTIVSFERRAGIDTVVALASTEHPEPHFQRADLLVRTPDLGSVKVRTARGDVWIANNRGAVDAVTSRGKIRVMTPWKIIDPITLVTSDGPIDLRLRGESRGWFDAQSVAGSVIANVKYGQWLMLDEGNDKGSVRAWLNGGTNPIVLRTCNAKIYIWIETDPVNTNPFTPIP